MSRAIQQLKSQLARGARSEFSNTDNRYTTGEGAQFNSSLSDKVGSEVHNPFLLEALMIGSIQQVQKDYGIAPAGTVSLKPEMRTPPDARMRTRE